MGSSKEAKKEELARKRKIFLNHGDYDAMRAQVSADQADFYNKLQKRNVDTRSAEEYVHDLEKKTSAMKFCQNCGELGVPSYGRCPKCGKKY